MLAHVDKQPSKMEELTHKQAVNGLRENRDPAYDADSALLSQV